MEAVRGRFHVWHEGCVIQLILLQNIWVEIAYELIPLKGGGGGGGAHTLQFWLITV